MIANATSLWRGCGWQNIKWLVNNGHKNIKRRKMKCKIIKIKELYAKCRKIREKWPNKLNNTDIKNPEYRPSFNCCAITF